MLVAGHNPCKIWKGDSKNVKRENWESNRKKSHAAQFERQRGRKRNIKINRCGKNEFLKTDLNEEYDWWEFDNDGTLTLTIEDLDGYEI